MSHRAYRLLNIVFIVGILFYYQSMVMMRQAQVDVYNAQVDKAQQLADEYQRRLDQQDEEAYLKTIQYGNGEFRGSGQGFGGSIELAVLVEDYQIERITTISANGEDAAYYDEASKVLFEKIKETKGYKVDVVSGATFSSRGIIEAARAALLDAEAARPDDEELLAQRENDDEKE